MRRGLTIGMLAAAISLAGALPAAAKLPPFSMQVEVSDLTTIVTLTIDQGTGYDPGVSLEDVIGILPAGDLGDDGRPTSRAGLLLVTVHPSFEPFVYVGTVDLPESGSYVAIPFPEVTGENLPPVDLHGGPVRFSTEGPVTSSAPPLTLAAGGVALVAAVIAAAWLGARSRRPVPDALPQA